VASENKENPKQCRYREESFHILAELDAKGLSGKKIEDIGRWVCRIGSPKETERKVVQADIQTWNTSKCLWEPPRKITGSPR
jgi:hypothetical protein